MTQCPCGSPARYTACCRPLHRGEREPEDAPTLVRARFSAYALKEIPFLWRTLHSSHADRASGEAAHAKSVRAAASALKYVRLFILDSRETGAEAEVLFRADLFERGRDRSFYERSTFARDDGHWRYRDGNLAPASALPQSARQWTIDEFLRALGT